MFGPETCPTLPTLSLPSGPRHGLSRMHRLPGGPGVAPHFRTQL